MIRVAWLALFLLSLPLPAQAIEPQPGSIAAGAQLFDECRASYLPADGDKGVADTESAAGIIRAYVEPICKIARMGLWKAMGSYAVDPTTRDWIALNAQGLRGAATVAPH